LGHEEAQCRIKQKASAEAQKQTKVKPAEEINSILEVEELANELEYLDDFPEIQEFMENMNSEVCVNHVNDSSKVCTVNSPTTGLILEISVAITLNSEVNPKSKLLNKLLIDTGCTRTIIKKASLPDQFFEQRKQQNEVTWTTNAGKFVTNYDVPAAIFITRICSKSRNSVECCC